MYQRLSTIMGFDPTGRQVCFLNSTCDMEPIDLRTNTIDKIRHATLNLFKIDMDIFKKVTGDIAIS